MSEGVDVNGVTSVMEEMSRRNRELFKLPPYVLYVSRAFSTLEVFEEHDLFSLSSSNFMLKFLLKPCLVQDIA